ncbi:tetratricopeptide repeat protein [Aquimarina litoralis]|uniref:tetratricopeptide repeat protein n=1 Tax=Aquimarina litoralis TaxID=584605 RepID=UPI001C5A0445|nr:tetratricopeptide repeat protein [Aquimarina litoralis]MBW1296866.1 tetratricopeptide repeat protein [Aquimarina litoralis]
MYYYLIIALQVFCIYHVLKNRREYYWYFLILFLPVIGSIIYIVTQVFNKKDLSKVQNEIVSVVNPTKKVNDLRKQVEFADTFQNRVNLGDALYEINDYSSGIGEYEIALNGNYKSDPGVVKKLLKGYYQTNQFDKVIFCAEQISGKPDFKGSQSQFLYGLALEEEGRSEEAEENLKPIDQRYSNYEERYTLAQFLIEKGKPTEAKEILSEILQESQHMSKPNRNRYRGVVNDVKKTIQSI